MTLTHPRRRITAVLTAAFTLASVTACAQKGGSAGADDYPSKPIEYFEPMLREVFARPPFDPAVVGVER